MFIFILNSMLNLHCNRMDEQSIIVSLMKDTCKKNQLVDMFSRLKEPPLQSWLKCYEKKHAWKMLWCALAVP